MQEHYMEEELFNIKSRFGEYPSYKVTKSGKWN